jgi:hemoglobin/transferrin/lactoferrin receptor protein
MNVIIRGVILCGIYCETVYGAPIQNIIDTNRASQSIVVTASRLPREVQSEPRSTYRIDAAEKVNQKAVRTTPDMLAGLPSVQVQRTSQGQSSPFLRGFTGFRTLCLIDGIRLNNSVFRDGPNQYWGTVDPFSIDRYEVVMGPSSVLYGSDAIGGTMIAYPQSAPVDSTTNVWQRRLFYRGATAERSNIGRAQAAGPLGPQATFTGGITAKEFGDLRGGKAVGEQEHTGYDEQDYDARVDYDLTPDSRLTFGHQTVNQNDAWRTHKTIYGTEWEGLSRGDDQVHSFDQHRDLTYLKQRIEHLNGPIDAMEWSLSRQAQTEDLWRVKKDHSSEKQGFDVTTWGSTLQLESKEGINEWVYGAEYYRDSVDSYARKYRADGKLSKSEIQGPVADDATYESAGIYLEDTLHLFDGRLDAVPGVRYTHAKADASRVKDPVTGDPFSIHDSWDALCGSLRLLAPLTDNRQHVLFTGASQGFRAPNLSDLTRFDTARSNEIETPVSDLDPERFVSYEFGLKSRFARLTSQATYYYTVIEGMIVRSPTGRKIDGLSEVTKKNAGDGYIHGVELSESLALTDEWSTWITASWMEGYMDTYPNSTTEQERNTISRLMPPSAEAGVRWQVNGGKYWTEISGKAADKADRLSAEDKRDTQRIPPGGTPGYAVCNLRAGSRITRSLDMTVALENIFDQDYRIHGSGINEPGRNLVLTAAFRF